MNIYAEPENVDGDTLANLGPLRALAGVWRGEKGVDVNPKAEGPETRSFIDHIDLQPIDPQTNGPQLFYGLRYHQHVVTPGEAGTYHDQIGYWLWEPATETIIQTLSIPRGQIAMAVGRAAKDATRFELVAQRGETTFGICSNPFLEEAFKTLAYRIGGRNDAANQRRRQAIRASRQQHADSNSSADAQSVGARQKDDGIIQRSNASATAGAQSAAAARSASDAGTKSAKSCTARPCACARRATRLRPTPAPINAASDAKPSRDARSAI